MKKKGFTLVELLAVIAILAILVIVAMPNVLGMFNQAKVSSFVTEVQKIMDTAMTTFTKDALLNSGKTVYYSSAENVTLGTKKLDMSGNEKNYFIEMDRNGEFKRVIVSDANYCYDIYTYNGNSSNGIVSGTKAKRISGEIQKTSVNANDVWEAGTDSVTVTMSGSNYKVSGCQGVVLAVEGDVAPEVYDVKIASTTYQYEARMTWEEWVNSSYNTGGFTIVGTQVRKGNDAVRYNTIVGFGMPNSSSEFVSKNHEIIKNENYTTWHYGEFSLDVPNPQGKYFYDLNDNGGNVIFEQEKHLYN